MYPDSLILILLGLCASCQQKNKNESKRNNLEEETIATPTENDDAQAQYEHGNQYLISNVWPKQVACYKAQECWEKAAEQGHLEAQIKLGQSYIEIDGQDPTIVGNKTFQRDNAVAKKWLLRAKNNPKIKQRI